MKSSKLIATRRARLLLVRRRKDKMWTLPGGKRKKPRESAKACLRRELREELPALRVRQTKLLGKIKNGRRGKRARNDHAIFTARKVTGKLVIGDKGTVVELGGARSSVAVPMLKDDESIGVIVIFRQEG